MSNNSSMFVPVGQNIFDLNSITNIEYVIKNIQVYVKNNPNGIVITNEEYQQLINYIFSYQHKLRNEEIPKYVLVGKNMFNTDMITHVMYNNGQVLVFINNNPNGMPISKDEYQLLIKYLLAG